MQTGTMVMRRTRRPVGEEMRLRMLLRRKQLLVRCGGAAALSVGVRTLEERGLGTAAAVIPGHQVTKKEIVMFQSPFKSEEDLRLC